MGRYASLARGCDTTLESIQEVVVRTASHTNRNRDGNLYVRYLYWNDGRWNWSNNWLDNDFNGNNPAAVRATLFTSHPAVSGVEFL